MLMPEAGSQRPVEMVKRPYAAGSSGTLGWVALEMHLMEFPSIDV